MIIDLASYREAKAMPTVLDHGHGFGYALTLMKDGVGMRRKSWPSDMYVRASGGKLRVFMRASSFDWNLIEQEDIMARDWVEREST